MTLVPDPLAISLALATDPEVLGKCVVMGPAIVAGATQIAAARATPDMTPLTVASIDANASTAALSSRGDVACNAEVVRTKVFVVDAGNVKAFDDATDKPKKKMRVVLNSISQYWVVGWKQKLPRVFRGEAPMIVLSPLPA